MDILRFYLEGLSAFVRKWVKSRAMRAVLLVYGTVGGPCIDCNLNMF